MRRGLAAALALLLTAVVLAPFIYMAARALMAAPGPSHWDLPLGRFALASAIFSLAVVAGQVVTSATAAYAFARLRFAGRDRLFLAYLSALAVPPILLVLPRFLLIESLGWLDTYSGLISTELVSVTGIFLLRQFFRTLPREVEDAARLEGAGEWMIFRRIVVPQAKPALATVALLAFADQWRSFLWPLVAMRASDRQVIEVGIANLQGLYQVSWPGEMAAAAAAVAPVVVLYAVARRYFTGAIEMTRAGSSTPI